MSASDKKPFATQRKRAKELLALVRAADPAAVERVSKIIHHFDENRFSLMTAQYVVAREAGFSSWADMLQSKGAK